MNAKSLSLLAAGLVAAFAFGGFSVWLYGKAETFDSGDNLPTFKGRVMERKSDALQGLVDSMLRGDLRQADAAATRLSQYASMIDGFLETDMYVASGNAYSNALRQFSEAAASDDWEAAKAAVLAVESSCMDCHQLLVAPRRPR